MFLRRKWTRGLGETPAPPLESAKALSPTAGRGRYTARGIMRDARIGCIAYAVLRIHTVSNVNRDLLNAASLA